MPVEQGKHALPMELYFNHANLNPSRNYSTVESLMSRRSRDSISTVLCHSIRFESPNDPCGATVEIKSRDRSDIKDYCSGISPKYSLG